jgi:carbon-monoxide dehydrogenase medium subunit
MAARGFEYLAPGTLPEALALLGRFRHRACVLAGGTDLLMKLRRSVLSPEALIDVKRIPGLDAVRWSPEDGLTLGATARLADVGAHPEVRAHYPALAHALRHMANVQVRNMGTVAGNLCNAAPCADTSGPLLVHEAELTLASEAGERTLPLVEFFQGPGLTARRPEELVTAIRVPAPPAGCGGAYQRLSARSLVDINAVAVAALVAMDGERCAWARVALVSVAPVPLRARRTEALLAGGALDPARLEEAGRLAADEASPISDVRASADYRSRMVEVLTGRVVAQAAHAAGAARRPGGDRR